MLYLKAQTDLLSDVRRRMRDPAAKRWTDPEIYGAINDALLTWHDRVIIPHIYEMPDGWTNGTARYTLPAYITGIVDPQQKRFTTDWLRASYSASTEDMWVDILNFSITQGTQGDRVIEFPDYLDSGDGRVIWWMPNGPVARLVPELYDEITADATTAYIATELSDELPDSGYIKISTEWIHYAGITRYSLTNQVATLQNLTRGLNNTTATSHSTETLVAWGVGAETMDLYNQLYHYVQAQLHGLFLIDAAELERAHHERMRLHYLDLSDRFWMTYTPARAPKLRLDRRGVGDVQSRGAYAWPY